MSGYFAAMSSAEVLAELAEQRSRRRARLAGLRRRSAASPRAFPTATSTSASARRTSIGVAAGLAHAGKLPFVLGMAPFVSMRGFEQIRDDCAYNRNNVKILAPFAGLEAGPWGATHHAIEDIALLRTIPGMTILSPADPNESLRAVRAAAAIDGPVYIRLGFLTPDRRLRRAVPRRRGGHAARRQRRSRSSPPAAACRPRSRRTRRCAADGIAARVLNVHTLKPLDRAAVERAARETGRIVTVEEHFDHRRPRRRGRRGARRARRRPPARVGVRDVFCTEVAPYPELLRIHGIDAAGIERAARALLSSALAD